MPSPNYCSSKSTFYSQEELAQLHDHLLPRHVAIIMDGNRRWAKQNTISKIANPLGGHWAGVNTLNIIIEAASELGIKVLTVYGFSTENWSRTPLEVQTLLHIFEHYLKTQRSRMVEYGIKFNVIGDIAPFSAGLKKEIAATCEMTKKGTQINLIVAMNYGGRNEITRAVKKISQQVLEGKLTTEDLSEDLFASFLDTSSIGDPDLLIRTSGEMRISNFLLWQLAYTEVYLTPVLWPDFTPRDLLVAVLEFQKRQRRRGS